MYKWISIGIAVMAALLIWRFVPVEEGIRWFIDRAASLGLAGAILFGLVYVAATVLMLPGSPLTITAGLVYGLARGFPLVLISATAGAALAFLIARYLARRHIAHRFGQHPRFQAIDDAIAEDGWKIVLLLRLSPLIPFNLQNYLYGLTRVRFSQYLWASFVGMAPGTLLYLYIGALGNAVVDDSQPYGPWRWALFGLGLAATAAATILVTRKANRKLRAIGVTADGSARDAGG